MGLAGESASAIEDLREREAHLLQAVAWLRAKARDPQYLLPPVDFRTFVESRELMNKPGVLWPVVIEECLKINSGRYTEVVLTGSIGVAKCLGRGTPVLMFDGTVKPVEAVVVGDQLMGPDSLPRTVVSAASGQDELFRVTQKGAAPYVVNSEHVLSLRYTNTSNVKANGTVLRLYGAQKDDVRNLTVKEYLALSATHRALLKGWKPDLVSFQGARSTTRI